MRLNKRSAHLRPPCDTVTVTWSSFWDESAIGKTKAKVSSSTRDLQPQPPSRSQFLATSASAAALPSTPTLSPSDLDVSMYVSVLNETLGEIALIQSNTLLSTPSTSATNITKPNRPRQLQVVCNSCWSLLAHWVPTTWKCLCTLCPVDQRCTSHWQEHSWVSTTVHGQSHHLCQTGSDYLTNPQSASVTISSSRM